MIERIDEWRRGTHRQREPPDTVTPAPDPLPGAADERGTLGGNIEPFSECSACGGSRFLRTEPVAAGTGRLTLVCDGCGARTEI